VSEVGSTRSQTAVADTRCSDCACTQFAGGDGAWFCAHCGHLRVHHGTQGQSAGIAGPDVVSAPAAQPAEFGLRASLAANDPTPATPQGEFGVRVSLDPTRADAAAAVPSGPPVPRRAWLLAAMGVVVVLMLAAAALAIVSRGSGEGRHAAVAGVATSHRPPIFAPSIGIAAQVTSRPGVTATPARDGGLWYQTPHGNLTRLAADTGRVAYAFRTSLPAVGLAIGGRSLDVLTQTAVEQRDRGTGRRQQSLLLPAPPICCGLTAAAGMLWQPLTTGLARIDLASSAVTVQPSPVVTALAGDQTRLWLLGGGRLIAVDPATGRPGQSVSAGDVKLRSIAVGADAIWGIGRRGSAPVVARFDAGSGALQLVMPLPAAATAVAVADRAVWLALAGVGVQELDPSTNSLAGLPDGITGVVSLLPATHDRLWAVARRAGMTMFTRIDLHATGR
jgi:hypothetical protein